MALLVYGTNLTPEIVLRVVILPYMLLQQGWQWLSERVYRASIY